MNDFENVNGNFGFNFTNFDPANITADEVILAIFCIDKSGSVSRYVSDLNAALNDFLQTIQRSHIADKVLVQNIEYNDSVYVLNGFQPIADVKPYNISPSGTTAMFDANIKGIENANAYKAQLEQQGISVKVLVFMISDGDDNASSADASDVKKLIEDVYTNESNFGSYTLIFFGVGDETNFTRIATDMGIRPELIAKVGTTGTEIRKMISWISSSVSSSGSGSMPTNVTF